MGFNYSGNKSNVSNLLEPRQMMRNAKGSDNLGCVWIMAEIVLISFESLIGERRQFYKERSC